MKDNLRRNSVSQVSNLSYPVSLTLNSFFPLGALLFDQFLDRVDTFDIEPARQMQYDDALLADELIDPEGHWHCLHAEASSTAKMHVY
jgi:hypothetical protein